MQAFVLCVSSLGRTQAVARQAEGEQTAFPHSGMQGDVAVMLVDDLFAQGQSDARTVRFGGVERDEDALLRLHGDALPVVLHADLHFVLGRVPAQMDFYFAFGAWGRVACVGN